MAQVIDTTGSKRASSSGKVFGGGNEEAVNQVQGSSHGGGKPAQQPSQLEPEIVATSSIPRRFTSRPFMPMRASSVAVQPSGMSSRSNVSIPPSTPVDQSRAMLPSSLSIDVSGGEMEPVEPIDLNSAIGQSVDDGFLQPLRDKNILEHNAGLDVWEAKNAEDHGRDVRTANLWDEEYDNGSKFGGMDNNLDIVGNTAINDVYIRDWVDSGLLTKDEAWDIMHHPHQWEWMQDYNDNGQIDYSNPKNPHLFDRVDVDLDDNSPNYYKLTSDTMTGTQYRHYRDDLGMGGRPGYIDPTQTYSKKEEADDYDFKPFIPDSETYTTMTVGDVLDIPGKVGRAVSNARMQYLTPDFLIEYDDDGERKSIPGKEFESVAPAYMNTFYHDRDYNPDQYLSAPTEGEYTTLVNQIAMPDIDGNMTYHYGHLVDVYPMSDGSFQFSFSDGSTVKTSQDYVDSVMTSDGSVDLGMSERVPIDAAGKLVDLENFGPQKHQAMINEAVIPDEYGNDTYHYFEFPGADDDFVPYKIDFGPNGTYTFTFMDGSSVNAPKEWFDTVYDSTNKSVSIPWNRVWIDDLKNDSEITYDDSDDEKPTIENADVVYYPDLVLSDGTRMTLDDVERIWMDESPDNDKERINPNTGEAMFPDDDISYQFGTMTDQLADKIPIIGNLAYLSPYRLLTDRITSRPARLGSQEVFTDGGLPDVSNIVNDVTDWTLGSVPISLGSILPWMYSLSGAMKSLSGSDPNSYNPSTNSYGLTMGQWDDNGDLRYGEFDQDENGNLVRNDDYSDDVKWSNFASSAMVPLSEMMVGPVGEHIVPLEPIKSRIPFKSAIGKLLAQKAVDAGGEAVEEILGNPFEEYMQYGWSGMYSNPLIDEENGVPVRDMYGHEKRKRDEPFRIRAANALNDTTGNANAALGGALVSAAMDLLMPRIDMRHPMRSVMYNPRQSNVIPGSGVANEFYDAIMQDRARLKTGTDLYVAPEDVEYQKLGQEYANIIDNGTDVGKDRPNE